MCTAVQRGRAAEGVAVFGVLGWFLDDSLCPGTAMLLPSDVARLVLGECVVLKGVLLVAIV